MSEGIDNDSSAEVSLDAPITFNVQGRVVHSPMVETTVGGIESKLILDTGSTAQVLTRELVERAGLEFRPTDPGTDHTGADVATWEIGALTIEVAGGNVSLDDVQVIQGPPVFSEWGIGGFLSPQSLSSQASLVIDFVKDRLMLVKGDQAQLEQWLRDEFPHLQLFSIDREPGEAIRVLASIEPFAPVPAMINTGTPETEFVSSVVPDLVGSSDGQSGLGLSGAEVEGTWIEGQTMRVGEHSFQLETLFIRRQRATEHPDAQIGMDVLKGSVLLISPDLGEPVVWAVPR